MDPNTPTNELPHTTWTDLGQNTPPHPAPTHPPDPHTGTNTAQNIPGPDGLTPARRHLQTLLNILRTSRTNTQHPTGLPQARLIVHCQLTTLLGLANQAGITQHGLPVSPGELRRELCNAGILPITFNSHSQILDLGREQRLVPDYMRQAILARDGGCLVPACTVPPEHCEMCHIDPWATGGNTSTENTAPACTAHHHAFHTGQYTLTRNNTGLPAIIQPRYLDPEQIPRRNTHWQQHTQTNPTLF